MDQMHSSSDPYHLVPVIAASGDAPMTGSVRDLKLHAETQAEKADANAFQQRLTCRGPASLQFWSHDLATTALHVRPLNGCDSEANVSVKRSGLRPLERPGAEVRNAMA